MEPCLVMSGEYRPIDHFISAREISSLDLKDTEVVVLSACKTGVDLNYDNAGISGIAKSFLIAVVKNVILTLWSIDDKATSEFMITFYEQILNGSSPKKALLETKKIFIQSTQYYHPYFWGPFVLYGVD
jgi:CHAT domain-containing protein